VDLTSGRIYATREDNRGILIKALPAGGAFFIGGDTDMAKKPKGRKGGGYGK